MFTVLSTRRLLFDASYERMIDLATRYDFEGVDPSVYLLAATTAQQRTEVTAAVRDRGLRWGIGALPFRVGEGGADEFDAELAALPATAAMLQAMGVTSLGTWFAPAVDGASYEHTFSLHVERLNRIAPMLADYGIRLALEYVGPATARAGRRHAFVHDLAGMRAVIGATAQPATFGLILDAFHWYTAGDTVDDLLALRAEDVLGVDLDDAPAGVAVDDQLDLERAQPCATGIIDTAGFVDALRRIHYDGPVMAEPFSSRLRTQTEEDRVKDARQGLAVALENA